MPHHRVRRFLIDPLFSATLLFSWSCMPVPYPPPPQIVLPAGPEPSSSSYDEEGLMLEMSDPNANSHIIGDMAPGDPGSEWRFTGAHPRFRLQLQAAGKLSFYVRFFLHEQSLRMHGPITLRIGVNGNSFQSYPFTQAGDMEYRKPIPESWIPGPGPVDIDVDVDPPWLFPDGTTYGILLHSIGFEKREN